MAGAIVAGTGQFPHAGAAVLDGSFRSIVFVMNGVWAIGMAFALWMLSEMLKQNADLLAGLEKSLRAAAQPAAPAPVEAAA